MSVSSIVKFFAPVAKVISGLASWELQTGANPSLTRQRAQALGSDGDEIASVQYGAQIAYSETGIAKVTTGNLAIPRAGQVVNGCHIDSIEVRYGQTSIPQLSINSHQHATVAGVAQTHDECRSYAGTVVLPARAIGVPTTLSDNADTPNTIFTLPAGCGMRSLTYSLSLNHVDEPDSAGDHLAGDNYDGVETLTLEFTGAIVISELDIDTTNWKLPDSDADSASNTGATTKTITLTRHLKHYVAQE